jgi:hypothetical protein
MAASANVVTQAPTRAGDAGSSPRTASISSLIDWKRASGARSRQRATTSAISLAMPGEDDARVASRRGMFAFCTRSRADFASFPGKSRRFASASQRNMPTAKTSVRASTTPRLSSCSGAE